ncbi:hypothetical protein DPMN_044772 [Dreissena polymorpha]|uniref:C2H2-type domain-containing protein n=1 Tax=Dreissena polymorpha TaxID=45954 RepID=A0A9D4HZ14_DREPO|nr:hypothetical protein DPMN_044772 [Dreissena polymorpha]
MKHQNCWLCHATLATQRQFERHVETVHQRLGVECPFCHVTIKRAADMKRHILTVHPDTKVPETAFHVREMACLAIFQEDFVKVYGPSRSAGSSFWRDIRSVSVGAAGGISVSHVAVSHGSSTVEGKIDNELFSLTLSDDIFKHPLILRRLAKRLAQLPLSHSPFDQFPNPVDVDRDTKEKVARQIGVGVEHITFMKINRVSSFFLETDSSGGSTPLLDEMEMSALSSFEDTMGYPGQLLIQADYSETSSSNSPLASNSIVPIETSSLSMSSVPQVSSVTSQPAACVEVPVTASSSSVSSEPHVSGVTSQPAACVEVSVTSSFISPIPHVSGVTSQPAACVEVSVTSSSISSIPHVSCVTSEPAACVEVPVTSSSISSIPHVLCVTSQPTACVEVSMSIGIPIARRSGPTEIISSANSEFLVPRLPPTPSNQMRAKKLLAMGAMPLFSPARREWDQDEAVTFLEPKFKWPPRGWKGMSADLRLMLTEFQAMSILQARGCNFKFERVELLNAFNFLVLPAWKFEPEGTSRYKCTFVSCYLCETEGNCPRERGHEMVAHDRICIHDA